MSNNNKNKTDIWRKLLWWFPIIILGLMFALGACTTVFQNGRADIGVTEETVGRTGYSSKMSDEVGTGGLSAAGSCSEEEAAVSETADALSVEEDGNYTSKEEVALYIHTFGRLPINYITKKEAQELGWDPSKGNLSDILPGRSIGGSAFGNYEGLLPRADGRSYFECDIDYEGGYRGAKRIVYSNDGLVFYTEDHYNTFEQLY